MKTVIMAGGSGTRIASLFPSIPKSLIPIAGIPVLERELNVLKKQGFTDIIITISYMGEKIRDYFGNGEQFGVSIEYFGETVPLGNAGALYKIKDKLTDDFLVINSDIVFDVNLQRMYEFHHRKGAMATILTHPNSHPFDSGIIFADENNKVNKWITKEDEHPKYYKNRVNAGIHFISKKAIDENRLNEDKLGQFDEATGKIFKIDLDRQILKPMALSGELYCYDSPEYVKDMGTPERYHSVECDILSGKVAKRNLVNKQKAIFLDRDGTINKYIGFLRKPEEFELLGGVSSAIKKINMSDYLCIVITNQPVIARGEVTISELDEIHNKLETLLGSEGCYIDALYYCPHHPDKGFPGEIPELKMVCNCRKPNPGMLLKAAEDFNIDLERSWMVGDSKNDIIAGKRAGCKTALIGAGDYGQDMTLMGIDEVVRFLDE